MRLVRLLFHVVLAGVYVFLTSVTLLVQLAASGSGVGLALVLLLGAWAGASATLRTKASLSLAALGAVALALLAHGGQAFAPPVALWVQLVLVPLVGLLWAVVAWRRWVDDAPLEAEVPAPV